MEVLQKMYSESIKSKVDDIFADLRKRVMTIVSESSSAKEATNNVTILVSSELTTRSKSILSDMLFSLTDILMETEYFKDVSKQNKFYEINLRQEILNKYQFSPCGTVDFNEASRVTNSLLAGCATCVLGGAIEIGYILIAGLKFSNLFPIPISVLIIASIGVVFADYYAIEPTRYKKSMLEAFECYLNKTQKQYLDWFDEVESYFNNRVEQIKKII